MGNLGEEMVMELRHDPMALKAALLAMWQKLRARRLAEEWRA
jgi:hypothetical protein